MKFIKCDAFDLSDIIYLEAPFIIYLYFYLFLFSPLLLTRKKQHSF